MKIIKKIVLKLSRVPFFPVSNEKYLKILFEIRMDEVLNLNNPQTFNEKIQWLKLHDHNLKYHCMVDKYYAKQFIGDIIGKEYIIPTVGIYKKFNDINFDELPQSFVIKCTHDSGSVVLCKNKDDFDVRSARKKINKALHTKYYKISKEWVYETIEPKIIIEPLLNDDDKEDLKDYKILCFNGVPKLIQVDMNRFHGHQRNMYDTNWNLIDMKLRVPNNPSKQVSKPIQLELMLKLASQIAKDIPFLRVDFYVVKDFLYFSEATFYPVSGFGKFYPKKWDKILGSWIDLSQIRK